MKRSPSAYKIVIMLWVQLKQKNLCIIQLVIIVCCMICLWYKYEIWKYLKTINWFQFIYLYYYYTSKGVLNILVIKFQRIFRNAVKWKCCLYKGPCLKYTSDATISSYYARTGIPFRHSSKFFYIQR